MKTYFYNLRYRVDNVEWRARAKRNLVFQFWSKYYFSSNKNAKILDFGCGTGVLQEQFSKRFNVNAYGIDTSQEAIDYCKKRGLKRVKVFDGKKIPLKANTFDLVTAVDVVEHVQRVLNKNGLAILLVPSHPELWSTRDINLQHFRRYRAGELESKCRKVGFKILTSKNIDFAVYSLFAFLHKLAPKVKGVTQIGMDTASTNRILNEIMYIYEQIENIFQIFFTFPIGLSSLIVAKKV